MSLSMLLPTLLLAAPPAGAQETWRPNDTIASAISAQVTEEGFDSLELAAAEVLPTLLAGQDLLAIPDIEQDVIGLFTLELKNVKVGLDVRSLDIVPRTPTSVAYGAELAIELKLRLSLNRASERYNIDLGLCSGTGWLGPTDVNVSALLQLAVTQTPTGPVFDVNLTLPSRRPGCTGGQCDNPSLGALNFENDCAFLLNTAGNALKDVLLDAVLLPQITPLLNDLEVTLEDALVAAVIDQEVDALGKTLFIELTPRQLKTTPDGLEFLYNSRFTAAQDPCVADYDPLGSLKTPSGVPAITSNPPGTQIAAYVSDDMLNQALYAAFSGGVLCITVDESLLGDSLPIAIDSSLIPLLAGQEYAALLPEEPQELIIRTQPKRVPQVTFQGQRPLTLELREFGIDLYTDMEGRKARIIGIDADADVGIDADFDATTGALSILGLEDLGSAFTFTVVGDVFIPGTEPNLVEGLSGLLETVLPLALGGLTDSLSFTLPSFSGLGLDQLELGAGGQQGDWLRAEAGIGTVPYGDAGAGCDSEGGCSGGCGGGCGGTDGSCGGGCSAAGFNLGTGLGVLLPLWALRRRRTIR